MQALGARQRVNLIFRAFSDPIRLRILALLGRDELCVGDLVAVLRVPQATASRHLAYLRRAGLVAGRRSGVWIHYALAPASGRVHAKLLQCLGACAAEVPAVAADARRIAKLRKSGGCCPR